MRSALSQMAKLEVFEEEREGTTVYAYVLNDTMLGMIVMINGFKVVPHYICSLARRPHVEKMVALKIPRHPSS